MLNEITKFTQGSIKENLFSILIPSWNNLEYLKLCINSIQKNSFYKHQIIVIINEGSDGTLEWVKNQKCIDYVHSKTNLGICFGLNSTRSLISTDYILYVNDDMYLLPDWDVALKEEIDIIGHKEFMISSTMIEPIDTGNSCVVVSDFGDRLETFNEGQLLNDFRRIEKSNWSGSTWPPNIVHRDMWDLVGGMSVEFSPGMYSDPDLSFKLWKAGVRIFKGIGKSKVYHFGSKSTGRIKNSTGSDLFLFKWGMTANTFTRHFLKRGNSYSGELKNTPLQRNSVLRNFSKRLLKSFSFPKY